MWRLGGLQWYNIYTTLHDNRLNVSHFKLERFRARAHTRTELGDLSRMENKLKIEEKFR
jgi:hypothetical protein